ncbi:tetratricopeptide repeat protein [Kribbella sp. NBC_01505]|uniref:ATP-binding protein n=1 Tax=Kribbella sp. NBC_01505 TaxID=2903580 RepID=UPI003865F44F
MSRLTDESLSDLLRKYRGRADLTQAALAAKAGLSDQAISVLERGTRRRPRIDTIRALIKVLRLDKTEAAEFLAVARGKSQPAEADAEPIPAGELLPMPWQLPPTVSDFTGRNAQIEAILDVLRLPESAPSAAVGLVAVTGMGGIGKTTLAVHAAHKLVTTYPDGHLYVNLRGYGPGKPMSTTDALRNLLRSLGVELQLIPDEVEEASALLRSQLTGRRFLLFLDNAADVQHVIPLLPGSPGSAAIITSRGSLANLPGARQVRLDALSESESLALLAGVVGPGRVAAEPKAAEVLAAFTGRLPLAVRLIGGRLAARPNWPIQHLVDLLEDEDRRLDSLGSDETGVRANIASSFDFLETSDRPLDREAVRALPLLSIPDGSDLRTPVVARLLDVPVRKADALLERLADLNLLESLAPERYRLHDLIRAYARELAEETLTAAQRDAGLERVLRFYIGFSWACQALTHRTSPRLGFATIAHTPPPTVIDVAKSLNWLDAEHQNVMDRWQQALGSTLADSPLIPELVLSLFGYHESRSRWVEMRDMHRGVAELAEKNGLAPMAAWLAHDTAIPEVENGSLDEGATLLLKALDMFRAVGDLRGQARCASSVTHVLGRLGRTDQALELGNEALRLSQDIGDTTVEGVTYVALGGLYDRRGDYARADESFQHGVQLAQRIGDLRSIGKRYLNTGFSHLLVGRLDDAVAPLLKCIEAGKQLGNDDVESQGWQCLAAVYAAQGRYREAHESIDAGMALIRRHRLREGGFLLEHGKVSAAAGDYPAAVTYLRAALPILQGISPRLEATAQELLQLAHRGSPYAYAVDNNQLS